MHFWSHFGGKVGRGGESPLGAWNSEFALGNTLFSHALLPQRGAADRRRLTATHRRPPSFGLASLRNGLLAPTNNTDGNVTIVCTHFARSVTQGQFTPSQWPGTRMGCIIALNVDSLVKAPFLPWFDWQGRYFRRVGPFQPRPEKPLKN